MSNKQDYISDLDEELINLILSFVIEEDKTKTPASEKIVEIDTKIENLQKDIARLTVQATFPNTPAYLLDGINDRIQSKNADIKTQKQIRALHSKEHTELVKKKINSYRKLLLAKKSKKSSAGSSAQHAAMSPEEGEEGEEEYDSELDVYDPDEEYVPDDDDDDEDQCDANDWDACVKRQKQNF